MTVYRFNAQTRGNRVLVRMYVGRKLAGHMKLTTSSWVNFKRLIADGSMKQTRDDVDGAEVIVTIVE